MRDANGLQRRRRLRMLQNGVDSSAALNGFADSFAIDPAVAREQLLRDCQGRTGVQLLVEVAGEAKPRKVTLDQPFVVIGRDVDCGLQIDHPSVLPFHIYVQWVDGQLFACSLGDSPAVAADCGWVRRKPIRFGSIRISIPDVDSPGELGDPQIRNTELASEVSQVQLRFSGVEQRDNLWPVDRSLTLIGRGTQCKLRLDHPEIPTVLASLVRTPTSCWLINLTGHTSLRANDQPVAWQSLDMGDRVQFGRFQAEVSTAPTKSQKTVPTPPSEPKANGAVRKLAKQHRQRLGALNKSLNAVQLYLDSAHLDTVPELKQALQQYFLHAERHHREMQEALEQLAES